MRTMIRSHPPETTECIDCGRPWPLRISFFDTSRSAILRPDDLGGMRFIVRCRCGRSEVVTVDSSTTAPWPFWAE